MSDYQKIKARALELQREKEAEMLREQARKAEREKQLAKDEAERKKRMEQLSREARARELMAANAKLVSGGGAKSGGTKEEYDPFAEDERRPASVAGPSKLSSAKGKQSAGARTSNGHGNGNGNGNGNGHGNGVQASRGPRDPSKERTRVNRENRGGSPPALGRKEKAARAFAQKAKRGGVADSVFSVRALVESREAKGGSSPAHVAPGSMSPARVPVSHAHAHANGTGGGGVGGGGGARKSGSRKKEIVGNLLKLCPERETRDRRTIDEIHRDIKVRKGILPTTVDRERERPLEKRAAPSRTASASASASPAKTPATSRPKPPPIPSTARPSAATTSTSRLPAPSRSTNGHDHPQRYGQSQTHRGRGRSSSPSTSSSSSSSTPPPRKRPRPGLGRSPSLDPFDVSATIQSMFRRPGAVARRYDDVESEGSSDMEAGLSDVEAEEERARRIARREDEQAEREEREHRLMKERKKREAERQRAKGR